MDTGMYNITTQKKTQSILVIKRSDYKFLNPIQQYLCYVMEESCYLRGTQTALKTDIIRGMVSLERDNLVVIYYLSVSTFVFGGSAL